MGRVRSLLVLSAVAGIVLGSVGCGKPGAGITPKTISITPSVISLEEGGAAGVSVRDSNGTNLSPATVTWTANPPSAVTVTTGGALCAGLWDSLTTPTFCSPGPATAVQLTASAQGATSAPITVFVHRHVERMVANGVGPITCPGNPTPKCMSPISLNAPACFANYQVQAFNNNQDITASLGPINWNAVNSSIVTLSTTVSGLQFNQVQATAKVPGQTQFYATAGNTNSAPVTFATCPVESVSLQTATGGTSLNVAKGSTAQLITATVVDTAGLTLLNPPLTWTSTNPTVVGVSASSNVPTTGNGSETDSISFLQDGGSGISAACLPPTCNGGFTGQPVVHPIFPAVGISVQVTGAPVATTVYSASSGCWDKTINGPVLGCFSSIIPVDTGTKKVGTPIGLPHTPTSMIMSASGTRIYVGSCAPQTQGGQPVCSGVAAVTIPAGSVTSNFSVTGDVIGVSPNGNRAVVSDISTSPNLVFLYDQATNASTPLLLAGSDHAKSATFSPDGSTVYIATCAALPCVAGPAYVYDPVNSLRKLATPTGVTDIAFHPAGTFVYLAGDPSTITVLNTCDNSVANDGMQAGFNPQILSTAPNTPQFIRALPVASPPDPVNAPFGITHFLVLNGPGGTGLEDISSQPPVVSPPVQPNFGCLSSPSTPFPGPTGSFITNTVSTFDLHQGVIDATQFLVAPDGLAAYVVPQNFSSVFIYNVVTTAPSSIALVGAQAPTTGGLTTDGKFLYVGSNDSLLHVLDTSILVDTQQIALSTNSSPATSMCSISSATQPCHPDFVVIKP